MSMTLCWRAESQRSAGMQPPQQKLGLCSALQLAQISLMLFMLLQKHSVLRVRGSPSYCRPPASRRPCRHHWSGPQSALPLMFTPRYKTAVSMP